jgi:hypothetical protein
MFIAMRSMRDCVACAIQRARAPPAVRELCNVFLAKRDRHLPSSAGNKGGPVRVYV